MTMSINKTRIISVEKYFGFLEEGEKFYLGIDKNDFNNELLKKIGFEGRLKDGDTVLPSKDFGPRANYNSEGKYKKDKSSEMVTDYYQRLWTWEQWTGYKETETKSKIVEVPYKRYPREFIEPPSLELTYIQNRELIIINNLFSKTKNEFKDIKHAVNLILEIFGYCNIYTKEFEKFFDKRIKKLNWEILPEGKYPWEKLEPIIDEILKDKSDVKKPVYKSRLEKINSYNADFTATGEAGFKGYFIFGFNEKNLYILENAEYGNATYILREDWEKLSKKTKSELLNNDLHEQRIIHGKNWKKEIENLFKKYNLS